MELRQLEAFVAVAEERNFTRAAERLFVAQSGLSATIRSLEKELRAPLFVRTTRRVELTPAGAALLTEARRTLASARAAAEVVEAVEGLERGSLTLGVMQASWLFDLAGLLARFRAAYPGIQIRLRQASSAEMARLLDEGVLDLIFTTAPDDTSERVQTLPLVQSPLVVVCARGDPLDGRHTVRLHTIADRNQVGFPPGYGVRTQADRAIHAAGGEPRVDLEVNDTTTLLDLVEAGLGIAILPEALAKLRPSLPRIAIHGQTWTWDIVAETVAPSPINPAARALWEMLLSNRIS
jgi:DNA-binding transcriptional LysR family regulator